MAQRFRSTPTKWFPPALLIGCTCIQRNAMLIPNPQRRTCLLVCNVRTCEQSNRKRRNVTGAQCTGGIDGVQSTSLDVCCTAECGTCGGPGCTPANTSSLTALDCCATEIVDSGVLCSETGTAPCILSTGKIYRLKDAPPSLLFYFIPVHVCTDSSQEGSRRSLPQFLSFQKFRVCAG